MSRKIVILFPFLLVRKQSLMAIIFQKRCSCSQSLFSLDYVLSPVNRYCLWGRMKTSRPRQQNQPIPTRPNPNQLLQTRQPAPPYQAPPSRLDQLIPVPSSLTHHHRRRLWLRPQTRHPRRLSATAQVICTTAQTFLLTRPRNPVLTTVLPKG